MSTGVVAPTTSSGVPAHHVGGVTALDSNKVNVVPRVFDIDRPEPEAIAHKHLNEPRWTLESAASRWTLADTLVWNDTQTPGVVLLNTASSPRSAIYAAPYDLLASNTIAMPFANFKYGRYSMSIRFQMSGQRMYQGRVIVGAMPMMTKMAFSNWFGDGNFPGLTSGQHAFLDAAVGDTVVLQLPFNSLYGYNDLASNYWTDTPYVVYALVSNQLRAPTGSSPIIPISVLISITNSEFHVPLPVPTVLSRETWGQNYIEVGERDRRFLAVTREDVVEAQAGVAAAAIAGAVGSKIIASVLPRLTGQPIDSEDADMDHPANTRTPLNVVRKAMGDMNMCRGVDNISKLSQNPGAQSIVFPEHFSGLEATSLPKIAQRMAMTANSIQWTTSNTIGTVLYASWISPFPQLSLTVPSTLVQAYQVANWLWPTPLEYVSMPFTQWSGGLKAMIQIVASQFHQGRLFVGYLYGNQALPSSLSQLCGEYGVYIDLSLTQREFVLEVPYLSDTPVKWCNPGFATGTVGMDTRASTLGQMYVVVVNPLVSNASVAGLVEFNVWWGAGSDFRLYQQSGNLAQYTPMTIRSNASLIPIAVIPTSLRVDEDDDVEAQAGEGLPQTADENSVVVGKSIPDVQTDVKPVAVEAEIAGPDEAAELQQKTRNAARGIKGTPAIGPESVMYHYGPDDTYDKLTDVIRPYNLLYTTVLSAPMTGTPPAITLSVPNTNSGTIYAWRQIPVTPGPIINAGSGWNLLYNGMLGWFSSCFRQYRGGLKYRLVFSGLPDQVRPFAIFFPNQQTKYINIIGGAVGCAVASVLDQFTSTSGSGSGSYQFPPYTAYGTTGDASNGQMTTRSNARFIIGQSREQAFLELECPFVTHTHTMLSGADTVMTDDTVANYGIYPSSGSLVFGVIIPSNVTIPVGATTTFPCGKVDVYQAPADDFRFGTWIAPPPVLFTGYRSGTTATTIYPGQMSQWSLT